MSDSYHLEHDPDLEHDEVHYAQVYGDAIAAINGARQGEWAAVWGVFADAKCHHCLAEALAQTAARLGSSPATIAAARAALETECDGTASLPEVSSPSAGPADDCLWSDDTQPADFGGVEFDAGQFQEMWEGYTTADVDTGATHDHDNFPWIYKMAQLLVEGIQEDDENKIEETMKGAGRVCRTCFAEAIASIAVGLVFQQSPSSAARAMLKDRLSGEYLPVLWPQQPLAHDDSQFVFDSEPRDD